MRPLDEDPQFRVVGRVNEHGDIEWCDEDDTNAADAVCQSGEEE